MSEEPKKTTYELSASGIALLQDHLPLKEWYKGNSKEGVLMTRGVAAYEALPDLGDRPLLDTGEKETQSAIKKRIDAWSSRGFQFEWTDKEKDATKVCIKFFLSNGALFANKHTVAVLRLLSLHDE